MNVEKQGVNLLKIDKTKRSCDGRYERKAILMQVKIIYLKQKKKFALVQKHKKIDICLT